VDKHGLFVGHLLYGRNNIYEELLVAELSKKFNSLQIVSANKAACVPDVESNKTIRKLKAYRRPIVDEIVRFFDFMCYGIRWCLQKRNGERVIILLSAAMEINQAALWLKRLFRVKIINLIIDTALGNILTDSVWDKYTRACFQRAEKLYKKMTASMALNERVFPYLQLEDKPCHITKIGHRENCANWVYTPARRGKKILVYTGSLIYYDGTRELLEAASCLDPGRYELHIYGRGPEEALVQQYQSKYPNIKLMGYLPNKEMKEVMMSADLLINPRIDNEKTDIFGFPSKIVEYLLSGTPVLTTRFAAMPEAYAGFVHLIERQSSAGIAQAIEDVFRLPEDVRRHMSKDAYDYVFQHHSYSSIVDEMAAFIDAVD